MLNPDLTLQLKLHCCILNSLFLGLLQEKETVEALELLLPIVLELIDGIASSQTHSRTLVETCLQWLRKICPSGHISSMTDCTPHSTLVELLRYLLIIIPDTFVGLDCFPLPNCVSAGGTYIANAGTSEDLERNARTNEMEDVGSTISGRVEKSLTRELMVDEKVNSIQKRVTSLTRAVSPVLLRNNEGRVVQALDRALIQGDIAGAYCCVYDEDFCSSNNLPVEWKADITSGTAFNLSGPVNPSELYAVRFLCEWAVCDFRDSRGSVSKAEWKQSPYRDLSRVYMAVSVLRMRILKMEEKNSPPSMLEHLDSGYPISSIGVPVQNCNKKGKKGLIVHNHLERSTLNVDGKSSVHSNPSSIHDLIYAWLDQHELWQGDSSERLPLLLSDLVREGLFEPDLYVKQLLCSGVLDKNSTTAEIVRASRHRHVLQHLPTLTGLSSDDDRNNNASQSEASQLYRIERRLALYGLSGLHSKRRAQNAAAAGLQAHRDGSSSLEPRSSPGLHDVRDTKAQRIPKNQKPKLKVAELKQLIATCLQFPEGALNVETKAIVARSRRKRVAPSDNTTEARNLTPGCEECSRTKRLKTNEGKWWVAQGSTISTADEDTWWVKKGPKMPDIIKVEQPIKPPSKQTTRGRPKTVRKTQSLAHLATNRTESTQGTTSSYVLETKVSCPLHQPSGCEGGPMSHVKDSGKAGYTFF